MVKQTRTSTKSKEPPAAVSVVTPPRRATKVRIKIKRSDASSKRLGSKHEKSIIHTETICMGDQMVLFVEKEVSKLGGFTTPLGKECLKDEYQPFSEGEFNCHSNDYYYLRKSHEDNSKIPDGKPSKNGKMYFRTAILAEPNPSMLDEDGKCSLELERDFRDACYQVLARWCNRIPASDTYVPWQPSHSMTKKTVGSIHRLKSLDEIFIDESVGKILYDYHVPGNVAPKDVYQFLKENDISCAFTRKANGTFSDYAVHTFGFPCDVHFEECNQQEGGE